MERSSWTSPSGENTAILDVDAEVCLRCGERLYHQETVRRYA
ncbi:MAG: YgiT-type zinc finger protein [Chloroflexota bacterium]|nr:YgiT-type zinc finger protein [Chloroflexota bacterium]